MKTEIENNNNTPYETISTYLIGKKKFLVQPVFSKIGNETLGTVLLRMIQSDIEYSQKDRAS